MCKKLLDLSNFGVNKNATIRAGTKWEKVVFTGITGYILFLPSEFCRVAWEEKSMPSFSPRELECLPVSLSNATGVFEYSGQEVKNTLPHLLYSFAHVISSPST